MLPAVLTPQARRDLLEAASWIAKDNPTAASGLRLAVLEAAQRIGDHPQVGMVRPRLADEPIRFLALTGYPYLIVYNSGHSPPLILRILHGARDLPDVLRGLIR